MTRPSKLLWRPLLLLLCFCTHIAQSRLPLNATAIFEDSLNASADIHENPWDNDGTDGGNDEEELRRRRWEYPGHVAVGLLVFAALCVLSCAVMCCVVVAPACSGALQYYRRESAAARTRKSQATTTTTKHDVQLSVQAGAMA